MAGRKLEKLQFYFFRDIHFQKEYHKQCALKSDLQKRALGQEVWWCLASINTEMSGQKSIKFWSGFYDITTFP